MAYQKQSFKPNPSIKRDALKRAPYVKRWAYKMRTHTTFIFLSFLLVAFLALHIPDADARGRVRFRGSGLRHGTQHSGPVLSLEQLRMCVAQQNRLNSEGVWLDQLEATVKQKAAEIELLEEKITQREPLVDKYSQESVDSFNALITKHEKFVAAYNGGLPSYNAEVDKYKVSQQGFNTNCAGHAYYEKDMQAVIAGK